jgi:hypothetical protein
MISWALQCETAMDEAPTQHDPGEEDREEHELAVSSNSHR